MVIMAGYFEHLAGHARCQLEMLVWRSRLGVRVSACDCTQLTYPDTKLTNPDTHLTNPDTHLTNPDTHLTIPDTHLTIPNTRLTNPGARPQKTNKNAQK